MFLMFMNRDSDESWKYSKDWVLLSKTSSKQFKISRTDCHFDRDVCEMFRVDKFPFVLFFKNNKIYRYKGSLELNETLNFLSGDNFMESEVGVENLQNFYLDVTGQNSLITKLHMSGMDFLKWC